MFNYESYRDKQVPWGPLGYVTYKRTYCRENEEWWQTCARVIFGLDVINCRLTEEEKIELFDHLFNLRCFVSGRALWQLGTENVLRLGADSLCNCWATKINTIESFKFIFNELMLGGGVGFNISSKYVYELPSIKLGVNVVHCDSFDVDFIVPDNREGWVSLLGKTLEAYFVTGKSFSYSTRCIRGKGEKIKTFGGTAAGPIDLVKGISDICKILSSKAGDKLKPIDCLDIANLIGRIVVSGNVRRSAQIAIGDSSDELFLKAKRGIIPNHRAMSNNSIIANSYEELSELYWEGLQDHGEPYGYINLDVSRKYGRIIDGLNYRPDPEVIGTNPCGEISLCDNEPCNLAEIVLPNVRNTRELFSIGRLLLKVVKAISKWPFMCKQTQDIVDRNHRVGIGLTGICQSSWPIEDIQNLYTYIESQDETRECIKLTTIKPSGTLSLLPGVTPGIHPAYSTYYIRRIRLASDSKLVDVCLHHGYKVEQQLNFDGTPDSNTVVVEFPVMQKGNTDKGAISQLLRQQEYQESWSDNAVSCTVYYTDDEIEDIRMFLRDNFNTLKGCSFLRYQDHGFCQAPYEAISEERYRLMVERTRLISSIDDDVSNDVDMSDCDAGSCPIR